MKRIKDPAYGYVEIPDNIVYSIIDTAEFQRLRDVIQTSYNAVYPSALHNRFVHSIGVYYLGCIAATGIIEGIDADEKEKDKLKEYKKVFEVACLLHDVGHAPFSHTGEMHFIRGSDRSILHKKITELCGDDMLAADIKNKGYKAAPHELMSVIIGLRQFGSYIEDKSFFARCITGYKYVNPDKCEKYKNCFIELLNSTVLDVDKVDYLIRDAFMSGYESVLIDYRRLLSNICIEYEENEVRLIFPKSALSVVENVVYAHDLEKKWIQSHPAVLYDAYLIDKAYEKIIEEHFNDKGYIPEEVLSVEGVEIGSFGKISLASDADIIFLLKQSDLRNDDEEYFHRTNRKHPLWKTEAEFHAIFNDQTSIVRELNKVIHDIAKSQEQRYTEVNEEVLKMLEDEREKFNDENEIKGESADDRRILSLETKNQQIELVCIFKDFSEKQGIPFDYVIIYANQFNSSFREVEFSKMRFSLPTVEGTKEFGEVSTVNTPKESDDSEFFYIFCPKKNNGEKVEVSELIEDLMNFAGKMNARTVRKKVK